MRRQTKPTDTKYKVRHCATQCHTFGANLSTEHYYDDDTYWKGNIAARSPANKEMYCEGPISGQRIDRDITEHVEHVNNKTYTRHS